MAWNVIDVRASGVGSFLALNQWGLGEVLKPAFLHKRPRDHTWRFRRSLLTHTFPTTAALGDTVLPPFRDNRHKKPQEHRSLIKTRRIIRPWWVSGIYYFCCKIISWALLYKQSHLEWWLCLTTSLQKSWNWTIHSLEMKQTWNVWNSCVLAGERGGRPSPPNCTTSPVILYPSQGKSGWWAAAWQAGWFARDGLPFPQRGQGHSSISSWPEGSGARAGPSCTLCPRPAALLSLLVTPHAQMHLDTDGMGAKVEGKGRRMVLENKVSTAWSTRDCWGVHRTKDRRKEWEPGEYLWQPEGPVCTQGKHILLYMGIISIENKIL